MDDDDVGDDLISDREPGRAELRAVPAIVGGWGVGCSA